jgi:hypothetical protein
MGFSVGQKVEVKYEGEWWNAEILAVDKKRVLIHYEGGTTHGFFAFPCIDCAE